MAYVILSLIAILIALFFAYLHRTYTYWERRGVLSEKPVPIFGNLKGVGRTTSFFELNQRIYTQFKTQQAKPPPFVGLYFFFLKPVFLINLDLIKQVLIKDFSNFHDRGIFYNLHDDPLTGNLLALEGEDWRVMRHKLTPVFTSGKMKHMFTTITTVADNLSQVCTEQLANAEGNAAVMEIKELCARYTMDVIGTCAFGIECNCLQDPKTIFLQKGRDIIKRPRHSAFVQSLIFTMPKLALKLRMKLLPDDLSEFFLTTVRDTIDYRLKNDIHRNDLMDSLIQLKAGNNYSGNNESIDLSEGLTLEQIAAQALVFFFAGFETASTIMTFCLFELAHNAEIQEKLRAEILSALKSDDDKLTYEIINELPYLEMVLAETLRKYPVLPHVIRKSKEEYPIPGGLVIPADTTVFIPIGAIHHDPEYYPEPKKFDPERFTPEAIKLRNPYTYLPFGDGPRNCIGLRFGRMQTKAGLIALLRKFKFSTCERTENPIELDKQSFVNSPLNGVYLKVEYH